jgi:hypothetical protein
MLDDIPDRAGYLGPFPLVSPVSDGVCPRQAELRGDLLVRELAGQPETAGFATEVVYRGLTGVRPDAAIALGA